jgi:hypothetical protein
LLSFLSESMIFTPIFLMFIYSGWLLRHGGAAQPAQPETA